MDPQREESASLPKESTGIPRLDEAISGGFPRPSITAIVGTPGSGTTTFCRQFAMSSLRRGKRVLALCADEPPEHFVRNLKLTRALDTESYIRDNKLIVLDLYSSFVEGLGIRNCSDIHLVDELPLYKVVMRITRDIASRIKEPLTGSNVFFDSLSAWSPMVGIRDLYRTIDAAREIVKERGYVVLVTAHEGALEGNLVQALKLRADNVIRMRMRWTRSMLTREMIIEKFSFAEIRQPVLQFKITEAGIEIV